MAGLMKIDQILNIKNVGIIVTGKVEKGSLKRGDTAIVNKKKFKIESIQSYKQDIDVAETGKDIGVKLSGVTLNDVKAGDVLEVK